MLNYVVLYLIFMNGMISGFVFFALFTLLSINLFLKGSEVAEYDFSNKVVTIIVILIEVLMAAFILL